MSHLHARSACLRFAAATCLVAALGGCNSTYTDYSAFVSSPGPVVSAEEYRMAPPDVIKITSKRVREINNHREQIRSDGMITLPLLGDFYVAGRTAGDVSAELSQWARQYYEDAEVTVRVVGYNSKKIYVFGEVSAPGPYSYHGANTILRTLARAQPSRLADPNRIQILRPGRNGEMIHRMTISLNRMVREGDVSLDTVLEEGDIIFVPANTLATLGLGLQQLLLPITPAASVASGPVDIDQSLRSSPYAKEETLR